MTRQSILRAGAFLGVFASAGGVLWPARAAIHVPSLGMASIQAGIDAAAFGDTVLVAPGVYRHFETREQVGGFDWTSCAFMKDGVVVKSSGGPDVTMIDPSAMVGPRRYPVIARYLASTQTALEGFTLQGNGPGIGMYVWLCGNFTVRECKVRNFDAGITSGGGMIGVGNKSLYDCEFEECHANGAGAIWATSGHLDLVRCTFRNCSDGAVYVDQGGDLITSATIEDCVFIDNFSDEGGGGGLNIVGADGGVTIRRCYFQNNVLDGQQAGGGGLNLSLGPATVENCVFVRNRTVYGFGGGLNAGWATGVVRNNTFVDNAKCDSPGAGASAIFFGSMSFENNVVVGSEGGPAVGNYGFLTSSCNVFWDNPQGPGIPLSGTDRVIDPMFCNPVADDYRLMAGSPCLPEDPIGCGLIGALEEGCGTVSIEAMSWGKIKGLYRIQREGSR